jgi:hypothetical protein
MCPACLATVAWIAGGAVSSAGLAAMVLLKLRPKGEEEQPQRKEKLNGNQQS